MKCIWAEVEVTRKCNLRCKSCLFSCNDAALDELTTTEIMGLIDEFARMNYEWLKLTGGEALLRKDIFQIIDYAKDKGLKVRLNSNCELIDRKVARKLNVDLVQASVDGLEETNDWLRGEGTFKRTMDAIGFLVDNDIAVHSNTVVTQHNRDELLGLCDMLSSKGVCDLGFSRMIGTGRGSEVYDELHLSTLELIGVKLKLMVYAKMKRYMVSFCGGVAYFINGCGASYFNPFVTSTGDVTPCCTIREKVVIGNVRESSYRDIFRKYEGKRFSAPIGVFGNCNVCVDKI